jgi:ABC-type nitrate/sulfonate/bicarbonate transport system substrate-binding protein
MATANLVQALTAVFNAADVKDYSGQGLNQVEIVRDWNEDNGYSAEQIAQAEQIAAEQGYQVSVTRRGRNLYFQA